ncbi:hypothetical protein [Streptomyces sp. NPDC018031]
MSGSIAGGTEWTTGSSGAAMETVNPETIKVRAVLPAGTGQAL